jgi:mitogen-activated protein kinase 1/3
MVDPPSFDQFEDIYIVLEFMETDLHKIIYSKNKLTDDHIQFFIYQILCGLKYIHSANVIHRDLKPSNLLLNSDCELKICDFGLARGLRSGEEPGYELTEYVVTRWYRAPEIMCACQEYDYKIDVWAAGCILGELLGREPVFPGDDYIQQMNLIFDRLGTPEASDLTFVTNDNALQYIQTLKKQKKKPWNTLFPKANPLALDLLDKMLVFNPNKRISVEEALRHPYLAELVEDLDNHKSECKEPFNFDFEKIQMTKPILKELMLKEIIKFRPQSPVAQEMAERQRQGAMLTPPNI